jgi:hypothetical protein
MAQILVTYDLKKKDPPPHKVFLEEAEKQNLLYIYEGASGNLLRLPNTTLWGMFDDAAAARDAFDRARAAAEERLGKKIKVEKRVVAELGGGSLFVSDKKKAPEEKWKKRTALETCRAHQLNDGFFNE